MRIGTTSHDYGQIVLAPVPDGHGQIKIRPVVILTSTEEIRRGEPMLVACVTTHIERPVPPHHIPLPWHRARHPRTGLDKPNVVKCDWLASIEEADIIRDMGTVPGRQMLLIAEALRRMARSSEENPPDPGA
jgi:mRNA-degrading endonuclease toxin of MazEF toxin-antitoxin module